MPVNTSILARGIIAQDADLSTNLIDLGVASFTRLDGIRSLMIVADLFVRETLIRICTTIASNAVSKRLHQLVDSSFSHSAVIDLRGSLR
jgi:hypothetical protein